MEYPLAPFIPSEGADGMQTTVKSFCRKCGADRHHYVLFEKTVTWADDFTPIDGGDTWSTLQCAGCHEISFIHEHWFSEDYEIDENVPTPIVHRDYFPPAMKRKPLEHDDLIMFLNLDDHWVIWLLRDIYSAAGMGAYALAAMGARAIIDHLVTTRSGVKASFIRKADELEKKGIIGKVLKDATVTAFDAGSAAAHRGFVPTEKDFTILLDITETLIQHLCILPGRAAQQARDAQKLLASTPPRSTY